jgi:hypothetical protein
MRLQVADRIIKDGVVVNLGVLLETINYWRLLS